MRFWQEWNDADDGPGIVFAAVYKDAHWLFAAPHRAERKLRYKTFKGHSRSLSRDSCLQAVIPSRLACCSLGGIERRAWNVDTATSQSEATNCHSQTRSLLSNSTLPRTDLRSSSPQRIRSQGGMQPRPLSIPSSSPPSPEALSLVWHN